MDITKFVVSLREQSLLDGDYATYRTQLSGKLLNARRKLSIATKNRGKYNPKSQISTEQLSENHDFIPLHILTAERAWAHAMAMKASHSADTKGINLKARSHIVSRLNKGASAAEQLAAAVTETSTGASSSPTDVLEARAYAALLRGAALFEAQKWELCVRSYAVARIVYSALSTAAKGDIFKDLLAETVDPSIRYAAYQIKIPRTEPVAKIARQAFPHADAELVGRINSVNPDVLKQGGPDAKQGVSGADGAPTSLTWRGREVKIEDAAISVAWAAVGTAKRKLAERLASAPADVEPKDRAAAYDEILAATQDAVDATKQAIDELKAEGIPQSDSRMQSLQITRTAVNFEMISWRIGRNRILTGSDDGAVLVHNATSTGKKNPDGSAQAKEEAPGRLLTRLKEKVVLYDGTLQSIESISELPGVANDKELSAQLEATSEYFVALKSLSLARSHSIVGNSVNALALVQHALDTCKEALPVLSKSGSTSGNSLRSLSVSKEDVQTLYDLLSRELQRSRALVEISNLKKAGNTSGPTMSARPLVERLSQYPAEGVDLENIVVYPPKAEPVPVKPIFLDVAYNYIDYPDKQAKPVSKAVPKGAGTAAAAKEEGAKPQKRGWFGFGR